jgi:hypothetical protein
LSFCYEHLVRYVGWYSNRTRGERARKAFPQAGVTLPSPGEEPATEFSARAKAAWARLIRKVYEANPLEWLVMADSVEKLEITEAANFRQMSIRLKVRSPSRFVSQSGGPTLRRHLLLVSPQLEANIAL